MSASSRSFADADVHAFVDGQMDFDRRAVFMHAMSGDADLRSRVESWRRQNDALTSTFGGIVGEPVPLRLMPTNLVKEDREAAPRRSVDRASQGRVGANSRGSWADAVMIALIAFLAGGAATIAAGSLGLLAPYASVSAPSPVVSIPFGGLPARAYEAHQTYATDLNHPVEIAASDGAHLQKWVQHRLAMPVRIPDLRPQGWTLIGGRILPGELGPAAFLLYGNGVDRLGLYMARTNLPQADGYSLYDNGAGVASVAYWVDEPVGYALTTSRDVAWLQRNGPALFRSVRAQARDSASAL